MPGNAVYGMLIPTVPAFLAALLDVAVDSVAVLRRDQGADLRLGVQRIADLQPLRRVAEAVDELVVEGCLDEDARPRLAALTGRVVNRPDRARDRILEVRVREDEIRALASELEDQPLDRVRRHSHHLAAGGGRAGERDLVDPGMAHEVRADGLARTWDYVDRAGRKTHFGRELGHAKRRQRRGRIRLENDR